MVTVSERLGSRARAAVRQPGKRVTSTNYMAFAALDPDIANTHRPSRCQFPITEIPGQKSGGPNNGGVKHRHNKRQGRKVGPQATMNTRSPSGVYLNDRRR